MAGNVAELDKALVRFLDAPSEKRAAQLRSYGPDALNRVIELAFSKSYSHVRPLKPSPTVTGRDAVDAWSSAIGVLGEAYPDEFLDLIDHHRLMSGKEVNLSMLSVLGRIDRERAAATLAEFAGDPDYLVRNQVIQGLAWRDDPSSVALVERHGSDPDLLVRLQAIRGIARRDRHRAVELLNVMVAERRLPPLLKWEATELLAAFRAGNDLATGASPIPSRSASLISRTNLALTTRRRWFRIGVVLLVIAQSLVWLFAGSLWWPFRGLLTGSTSLPRGTWDAYIAIAFFAVAVISLAVLLQFVTGPGRRALVELCAIQIVSALAALGLTLLFDQRWIVIVALAVPTLALLYLTERPVVVTLPPTTTRDARR